MGFLDKAKEAAEQATARAKEGVEEVQTKRNLFQAYQELGRTTYELIEAGQISHDQLTAKAQEIRALQSQGQGEPAGTTGGGPEPPPAAA
jgi:hypothetical protein